MSTSKRTPREDQERPREGRDEMKKIPGRPAWERPAGPTLQPLGLSFGVEVKHTDYNCVQLTLGEIPTLEHYK